jgi:FHA domain
VRLVIECAGKKVEYPLTEGTVVIGREKTCDIAFPEPSLSRRHVMCTLRGQELIVRDMNTKNGTFLGHQRIEEARVWAGVRLRAGNCTIHLEADEGSAAKAAFVIDDDTASMPSADGDEILVTPIVADLESQVPNDPQFQEDDEATPLEDMAEEAPAAAGAEDGTRLVVKDNRWFVQDLATGSEVEIVPVTQPPGAAAPGQPAPVQAALPAIITPGQPGAANLPAISQGGGMVPIPAHTVMAMPEQSAFSRIWANPRQRLLIMLGGALVVALLVILTILLQPKPKPKSMSDKVYRQYIGKALIAFDKKAAHDVALQILDDKILNIDKKLLGRPNPTYALLVRDAIAADKAVTDGLAGGLEEAEKAWKQVRDLPGAEERARAIATKRLSFFVHEEQALGLLNEAGRHFTAGEFADCVDKAEQVFEFENTALHKQAKALIAKAGAAIFSGHIQRADKAEQQSNWISAVHHLNRAITADSSNEAELKKRIAKLTKYQRHEAALKNAQALYDGGRHGDALAKLRGISADSPYADETDQLRKKCRISGAQKSAQSDYRGGSGARALKTLKAADMANTSLATKIGNVIAEYDAAMKATDNGEFETAIAHWKQIRNMEGDGRNWYVQRAKTQLGLIPEQKKALAQQVAEEGHQHVRNRQFSTALKKYTKVLRMDPDNREAAEGLKKMGDDAEMDYNLAMAAKYKGKYKKALQYLVDVMDRLPATHNRYTKAKREIARIKEKMGNK